MLKLQQIVLFMLSPSIKNPKMPDLLILKTVHIEKGQMAIFNAKI